MISRGVVSSSFAYAELAAPRRRLRLVEPVRPAAVVRRERKRARQMVRRFQVGAFPRPSDAQVKARYAEAMGREWSDAEPRTVDFGGPAYPGFGASLEQCDAWFAELEAWNLTAARAEHDRAYAVWLARRAQFGYRPNAGTKAGRAEVLSASRREPGGEVGG